eukprot:355248-Chlamydomonas_euryale.AAC.1
MAVGAERARPVLAREDGGVRVEAEAQVVLDEVLSRHAQIKGVPGKGKGAGELGREGRGEIKRQEGSWERGEEGGWG